MQPLVAAYLTSGLLAVLIPAMKFRSEVRAYQNSYNYQYTFMVEIVPVCKEDIVCLPYKVSLGMGGVGPIMLVSLF